MSITNQFKVFIAGEHPIYRELRRQYLLNLGFRQITCFDQGLDCIAQLHQQPDIILIDHSLLPSNGLDILRNIKNSNPDIYILFIAGRHNPQAAIDALRAGAFDYIARGENEEEQISSATNRIMDLLPEKKEPKEHSWMSIRNLLS